MREQSAKKERDGKATSPVLKGYKYPGLLGGPGSVTMGLNRAQKTQAEIQKYFQLARSARLWANPRRVKLHHLSHVNEPQQRHSTPGYGREGTRASPSRWFSPLAVLSVGGTNTDSGWKWHGAFWELYFSMYLNRDFLAESKNPSLLRFLPWNCLCLLYLLETLWKRARVTVL